MTDVRPPYDNKHRFTIECATTLEYQITIKMWLAKALKFFSVSLQMRASVKTASSSIGELRAIACNLECYFGKTPSIIS